MKQMLVLGGAVSLASCAPATAIAGEATPAVSAGTVVQVPSPAANAMSGAELPGRYEVTLPGGKVITQTINPDGTYVDVLDGAQITGRWRMIGAQACLDPDGDRPEQCYTPGVPAGDGSFVVTSRDGKTKTTVRRIGDVAPR